MKFIERIKALQEGKILREVIRNELQSGITHTFHSLDLQEAITQWRQIRNSRLEMPFAVPLIRLRNPEYNPYGLISNGHFKVEDRDPLIALAQKVQRYEQLVCNYYGNTILLMNLPMRFRATRDTTNIALKIIGMVFETREWKPMPLMPTVEDIKETVDASQSSVYHTLAAMIFLDIDKDFRGHYKFTALWFQLHLKSNIVDWYLMGTHCFYGGNALSLRNTLGFIHCGEHIGGYLADVASTLVRLWNQAIEDDLGNESARGGELGTAEEAEARLAQLYHANEVEAELRNLCASQERALDHALVAETQVTYTNEQSQHKFCPGCGHLAARTVKFCAECGNRFRDPT